jgi:hypothetical protein
MTDPRKPIWASVTPWRPLTEIPVPKRHEHPVKAGPVAGSSRQAHDPPQASRAANPLLAGLSAVLIKLLYDLMVYSYSSLSVRIKRLGSARAVENAKLEGCEKGFILESAAGATTYLIPLPKAFEALGFPCPYKRDVSPEHTYFVGWGQFLLKQDPANKSAHTELKVGDSNCTSDIVTVRHDGTRTAWEVTLSTTNVLSNAGKYAKTDFARIVFLCRDYRLREAVKACCREGGLAPNLLAQLDYWQFSTLLRRQRKLSLY